ncbi:MAG: Dephospho-CoA kinase [Firmicutes bacterium]|nr:Dephospho-CoA kinase [candidate division NPL-UPA2 bacterium]
MLRIGITGGLSTGKSTVTAMLSELGVPTISADAVGHRLLATGSKCYAEITATFGDGILSDDGSIDRALLGAVVFADARKRLLLESLLHPAIWDEIDKWCREHAERGACLVAIEVPLLFEAKLEHAVDEIWLVTCKPPSQLVRAIARGLTQDEALARINAQMPLEDKAWRAHRIINTDCSLEKTHTQVSEALASVCGHRTQD